MILVVLHSHFRPGGVRRVIEVATPHLVAAAPSPVRSVLLAAGEAPDDGWLRGFRQRLGGVAVKVFVATGFGYAAEQDAAGKGVAWLVEAGLHDLLHELNGEPCVIWAHNLGLGRNLPLARGLTNFCHRTGIPLVAHHHDWWFENRWHHYTAMRGQGFRTLSSVAQATLAAPANVCHVAINRADARILEQQFRGRAGWLPNPVEPVTTPVKSRIRATRTWLTEMLGEPAPVWLLPCRLLRRKNIAEALLLTRWLRPEAWLVTTAGASSAEERAYAEALGAAARAHGWRLRLGVLQGNESRQPTVPELFAASEAILLTSLQEGFGLPYLEAAAAGRPLVARRLPNIAPDLARFGFRFPQLYREVLVDPALFDWQAERRRQRAAFAAWKKLLPATIARHVAAPAVLAAGSRPAPVPFSRLTLTAQLEVLAQPVEESWRRCVPLNPFLKSWRTRAATGGLAASPWPPTVERWLSGESYARRFHQLVPRRALRRTAADASDAAQSALLRQKLKPEFLYPLLWNSCT